MANFALAFSATALACISSISAATPQAATPNIVVLMADDLGYVDLGCYGAPLIATPRIDAMAAEGIKLTSFYVQPVCTPTRAAILTGSHPARVGAPQALAQWSEVGLNGDETTIAEVVSAVGYRTGYFGKWHLGDSPDQLPAAQGFQDVLANPWGHLSIPSAYVDSQTPDWEWNPDARFDTQRFTARALDFITAAANEGDPFLCMLSYNAPHFPALASPAFEGISADGREFGDAVEEIDHSVGVLLDRIDTLGIGADTLVIFLSDNGPALNQGSYQAGSAGPLRGGKGTTFEGGVRVPFVARWTGMLPAGLTIEKPAADVDFMPMIAALSGGTLPSTTLDGEDMLPVLTNTGGTPNRPFFYLNRNTVEGVRVNQYKLHLGMLYDLSMDEGETVDLSSVQPAVTAQLATLIADHQLSLTNDTRPVGVSSRIVGDWRTDIGLPNQSSLVDGQTWREDAIPFREWKVIDEDPAAELELVPRVGPAPAGVPDLALRQGVPGANVRLESNALQMAPDSTGADSAFTVELWTRSVEVDPLHPIVILDVGDGDAGFSMTVGDGGLMGDDSEPGRADDVRIRIGGAMSPASATLTHDLPNSWSDGVVHVAFTFDPSGDLVLYLQGLEVAATTMPAPGALWGAASTWSLMGRNGALGGDGGTGDLPFPADGGLGELSGIGVRDRAFFRPEVERRYCRNLNYQYCTGRTNSAGTRGELDLFGSFRLADDSLTVRVAGLPAGTFGYLISSMTQARAPISSGFVCVNNPIYRFAGQVPQTDATGSASFVLDRSLAPTGLDLSGTAALNFQFWYRDGIDSNFTNAQFVQFCQ